MMTLRLLFLQTLIISVFFLFSCNKDSSPADELSVSFTMNKTNTGIGDTITFTNTSKNCTSYDWDFGDGHSSIDKDPIHSYSSTGEYSITLTGSGDAGSESADKTMLIWDIVLNSTYYGDSIKFEGPTNFKSQPVKLQFFNESQSFAAANLVKHNNGYSHQDMLDLFPGGISYAHHPDWTIEIWGVWREIDTSSSHIWIGNLEPGIYTLVSARVNPLTVWYAAGLTVQDD